MEIKQSSITEKARSILKNNNNLNNEIYPSDHLAQVIEDTQNNINKKVKAYKWSGMIFLILIPLLSTSISILLKLASEHTIFYLSLILTMMTILNSIFKPRERFREACLLSISIEKFTNKFLFNLARIADKSEIEIHEYCLLHLDKFDPYRRQLIDLFLPESAGEKKNDSEDSNQIKPA